MSIGTDASLSQTPAYAPFPDMLRATAAFLVLIGHTRYWIFMEIGAVDHPGPTFKLFWLVTVLQREAVVIFFVLSGFLVGGTTLRALQAGRFDGIKYLVARFSRIYVVFAPSIIVTWVIFVVGGKFLHDFGSDTVHPLFSESSPDMGGAQSAACHIICLQGLICDAWSENPALWSLGYEWALYLVAPALLSLAVPKAPIRLRLSGLAILTLAIAALYFGTREWLFWLFAWFAGVLAAQLQRWFEIPRWIGLAGVLIGMFCMVVSRVKLVDSAYTDSGIAIGITVALTSRALLGWSLAPIFFKRAASFSYSLYAIHLPLVFLSLAMAQNLGFSARRVLPGPMAFTEFGLCVIVSVAFAYVFSIFTEHRTERLRMWILARFARGGDNKVIIQARKY